MTRIHVYNNVPPRQHHQNDHDKYVEYLIVVVAVAVVIGVAEGWRYRRNPRHIVVALVVVIDRSR